MQKIRVGDKIIVITGQDKGKVGDILSIKNNRTVVSGVNVRKKAIRPSVNSGEAGGFKSVNLSIDLSNVAIFNPQKGKVDKIKIKLQEDGKKIRVYRSDDQLIEI